MAGIVLGCWQRGECCPIISVLVHTQRLPPVFTRVWLAKRRSFGTSLWRFGSAIPGSADFLQAIPGRTLLRSSSSPMSLPSEQSWPLFSQQLADTGQRRLVLVEGEQEWARGWVQERLGGFDLTQALWVGCDEDAGRAGVRGVSAGQYKRWLGRETGVLVWDGWQGNPPDGFAGLAGTLRAGGLLFWLMPPLAQWPGFEDPDYSRTGLDGAGEHPFLARLAERSEEHTSELQSRPHLVCRL